MTPLYPDRLCAVALEVAARGALVLMAAAFVVLCMRRSSASARALAWRLALFSLVALPLFVLVFPRVRVALPRAIAILPGVPVAASPSTRPVALPSATAPMSAPVSEGADVLAARGRANRAMATSAAQPLSLPPAAGTAIGSGGGTVLARMLVCVWLVGALALLLRWSVAVIRLRTLGRSPQPPSQALAQTVQLAAAELGVRQPLRVLISNENAAPVSPMTWGFLRPTLLLPADVETWPKERLHAVLLHELAHIRRADWAARVASGAVCALYWPNPMVWLAAHRMQQESEAACDDRVLQAGVKPADYATHLLEVVRMRRTRTAIPRAAIAMADSSHLETRVRAVLDPRRRRRPPSATLRGAIAAAVGLCACAAGITTVATAAAPSSGVAAAAPASPEAVMPLQALPDSGPGGDIRRVTGLPHPSPVAPREPLEETNARLTGPVTATVGADRAGDKLADVAWGATADGLKAGVRITGGSRVFSPGERVGMECFIRNVTGAPIALSYAVRMYEDDLPIIYSVAAPGVQRPVQGVSLRGIDPAFLLTLKAHETLLVVHHGFVLGDKPLPARGPTQVPKGLEQFPYLVEPAPGQYTVQQPFMYHIATPAEVDRLAHRSHAKDRVIIEPFSVTIVRPDGAQYHSEATTIPYFNEKASLVTGPAPFSIREPAVRPADRSALDRAADAHIAWGPVSGGLQAGLRPRIGGPAYPLGATVALDYVIRNASAVEIAFDHDVFPGVAGIVPDVIAANGKPANTFGMPILHTSEIKRETLAPGATVVIGQTAMGIAGDGVPWYATRPGNTTVKPTGEKTYNYLNARPGRYRMRHLDTIYPVGGAAQLVLYTGYLPLEIFDPVRWGRARNGLQAGLAMVRGEPRYTRGSTVQLDCLVRNIGKEDVAFTHMVSPTYSFSPITIVGPNGRRWSISSPAANRLQEPRTATETLRPGDTIIVGRLQFQLRPSAGVDAGLWDGPGVYHVSQNIGDLDSGVMDVDVADVNRSRAGGDVGTVF